MVRIKDYCHHLIEAKIFPPLLFGAAGVLLLLAFRLPYQILSLPGILVIAGACACWGMPGGVLSSLWLGGVTFLNTFFLPVALQHVLLPVTLYFLFGLSLGICIDVINRQVKEIRKTETQYQNFVDYSPDYIYTLDHRGCFTSVSTSLCQAMGIKAHDILGKHVFDLGLPHSFTQNWNALHKRVRTTKKNFKTEISLPLQDGSQKNLELLLVPLQSRGIFKGIQGTCRDITDYKQAEKKSKYMVHHDTLTRLYNRTYMEKAIKQIDNEGELPISIVLADLNGLKLVNDAYGPSFGDQMLKKTAKILKKSFHKKSLIARWGGDEFLILLPRTGVSEAQKICEHITAKKHSVKEVPLSLTMGTSCKERPRQNIYSMLKEAEDRMYKLKLAETRSTRSKILSALLKTLGEKSYETEEHALRMQNIALKMGMKINLPQAELKRLALLVSLHDIGKINIAEDILTKPGPLNKEEWKIIKKHPETGYRITMATEEFSHVANDILAHHERWDGYGYPNGLRGEEIPILARITSIVDAYDVMTNGRPYKAPVSSQEAFAELKRCSWTQFDGELVDICLAVFAENKH